MARPREHGRRVTTAIRFAPEVHEALKETADELGVGMNWLVNRAVEEMLERIVLPLTLTRKEGP